MFRAEFLFIIPNIHSELDSICCSHFLPPRIQMINQSALPCPLHIWKIPQCQSFAIKRRSNLASWISLKCSSPRCNVYGFFSYGLFLYAFKSGVFFDIITFGFFPKIYIVGTASVAFKHSVQHQYSSLLIYFCPLLIEYKYFLARTRALDQKLASKDYPIH